MEYVTPIPLPKIEQTRGPVVLVQMEILKQSIPKLAVGIHSFTDTRSDIFGILKLACSSEVSEFNGKRNRRRQFTYSAIILLYSWKKYRHQTVRCLKEVIRAKMDL